MSFSIARSVKSLRDGRLTYFRAGLGRSDMNGPNGGLDAPVSLRSMAHEQHNADEFPFLSEEDLRNPFTVMSADIIALICTFDCIIALEPDSVTPHGIAERISADLQLLTHNIESDLIETYSLSPRLLEMAHYALCCFIDEYIMSSSWPLSAEWAERPSLLQYHQNIYGGDRFFENLESLSPATPDERALIEFKLLLISLGYLGMFGMEDRSKQELLSLSAGLRKSIAQLNGASSQTAPSREVAFPLGRENVVDLPKRWKLRWPFMMLLGALALIFFVQWQSHMRGLDDQLSQVRAAVNALSNQLEAIRPSAKDPIPAFVRSGSEI